MKIAELKQIIQAELNNELEAGLVVDKASLTRSVVDANRGADDSEFSLLCAYHTVQIIVGDLIRTVGKQELEINPEQGVLPGFKHVRASYSIVRDKRSVAVSIRVMTRDELLLKVVELRAHGFGALEHANELEQYVLKQFDRPIAHA